MSTFMDDARADLANALHDHFMLEAVGPLGCGHPAESDEEQVAALALEHLASREPSAAERAALDALGAPSAPRTVHTIISAFETDIDAVFLLVPVPVGPEYSIGDRVTITFEETP